MKLTKTVVKTYYNSKQQLISIIDENGSMITLWKYIEGRDEENKAIYNQALKESSGGTYRVLDDFSEYDI